MSDRNRIYDVTSVAQRFWPKVVVTPGCWLWTAGQVTGGYGHFAITRATNIRAHRMAYILACGPIPKDKLVLHKCDNPICVNPDHLYIGTHADNANDKVLRGRTHRSILSPGEVSRIKILLAKGRPQAEVALQFDVSQRIIERIEKGITWRHIK